MPLHGVAADLGEPVPLHRRLDALGDDLHAELVGEAHHPGDDAARTVVGDERAHEAAVDLHEVRADAVEQLEGRAAAAEVVDRDAQAGGTIALDRGGDRRDVLDGRRLGDLDGDALGIDLLVGEPAQHARRVAVDRRRRDVDADRRHEPDRRPLREVLADAAHRLAVQPPQPLVRAARVGEQRAGGDDAAVRRERSRQRFGADGPPRRRGDDGLVPHDVIDLGRERAADVVGQQSTAPRRDGDWSTAA